MRLVIAITAGRWNGIKHRPHHFMKRWAREKNTTVFFVEAPFSALAPVKNKNLAKVKKGIRQITNRLYVVTLPWIPPFGNQYRRVNRWNQKRIAHYLKKILLSFPYDERILYSFLPNAIDLQVYLDFDKIIYDCVDDHASFTGWIRPEVVRQMEYEMIQSSTTWFVTAEELLKNKRSWNKNVHLIRNGAEYEHFSKNSGGYPEALQRMKKPIAGFVGGIHDWMDIPLMEAVAKEMPSVSFVFIGPIHTNVEALRRQKNVYFLGSRSYESLPAYIHQFDVCLIPFKVNALTRGVNPVKMYEYLSTGLPVVSSALPEVKKYSDIIDLAETKGDWVRAIQKNCGTCGQAEMWKRKKVGHDNSWDARWGKALRSIK